MKASLMAETSILVVDEDPQVRNFLQRVLQRQCGLLETAAGRDEAEQLCERCHFDLLITDCGSLEGGELGWLRHLRTRHAALDVILMPAGADLELAITALREGISDLLRKPFSSEDLTQAVRRCLRRRRRAGGPPARNAGAALQETPNIIGRTPQIRDLCELIRRVAPTASNILIEGETGTGKELVAQAIHELSMRAGPFVPVNCGSISAELLESELFGHTKGAFTGAYTARKGLCHYAQGGTLFLDEIGEMSMPMQVKLLRMLEQRVIRPVGVDREQPVDCRVVAATNCSLEQVVNSGRFREDLYYRLNVLTIGVPSLRERPGDIPLLARYFTEKLADELNAPPLALGEQVIARLQQYHWPGNVRELRNIIERALLLGEMPANCFIDVSAAESSGTAEFRVPPGWTLGELEKHYLIKTLDYVKGNKSEAARRLGISRKTIERKLQEWRH
jgi:two-component system NtrC family response regulator